MQGLLLFLGLILDFYICSFKFLKADWGNVSGLGVAWGGW